MGGGPTIGGGAQEEDDGVEVSAGFGSNSSLPACDMGDKSCVSSKTGVGRKDDGRKIWRRKLPCRSSLTLDSRAGTEGNAGASLGASGDTSSGGMASGLRGGSSERPGLESLCDSPGCCSRTGGGVSVAGAGCTDDEAKCSSLTDGKAVTALLLRGEALSRGVFGFPSRSEPESSTMVSIFSGKAADNEKSLPDFPVPRVSRVSCTLPDIWDICRRRLRRASTSERI